MVHRYESERKKEQPLSQVASNSTGVLPPEFPPSKATSSPTRGGAAQTKNFTTAQHHDSGILNVNAASLTDSARTIFDGEIRRKGEVEGEHITGGVQPVGNVSNLHTRIRRRISGPRDYSASRELAAGVVTDWEYCLTVVVTLAASSQHGRWTTPR